MTNALDINTILADIKGEAVDLTVTFETGETYNVITEIWKAWKAGDTDTVLWWANFVLG